MSEYEQAKAELIEKLIAFLEAGAREGKSEFQLQTELAVAMTQAVQAGSEAA